MHNQFQYFYEIEKMNVIKLSEANIEPQFNYDCCISKDLPLDKDIARKFLQAQVS